MISLVLVLLTKQGGRMNQTQGPISTAEGIVGFFSDQIDDIFSHHKDDEKNLVTERNSGEDLFDNFFLNGGFPVT